MPAIATASSTQTIDSLRKGFGDSPLGGKQRYRVRPSGQPRLTAAVVGHYLERKVSKLATAVLAPLGLRTKQQLRQAVASCSHRVGDLLGTLFRTDPKDHWTVRNSVARCFQAADTVAALPGSGANDPHAVLDARLKVHLAAMSLQQLADLNGKLEAWTTQLDCLEPEVASFLPLVTAAVNQQIHARADQAERYLLTALTHSDAEMRSPLALQACARQFNAAMGALPAGAPRKSFAQAMIDQLPHMPLDKLREWVVVLRAHPICAGVEGSPADASPAELMSEAHRLIQALVQADMPVWMTAGPTEKAKASIQTIARQEIDDQAKQEVQMHTLDSERIPARMGHQFVRDLRSAYSFIESADGQRRPLLDPRTIASQGTPEYREQMEAASAELLKLTGGDQEWLFQVSRFCHQGLVSFAQKAQTPDVSPFELNGVRGQLAKGTNGHEISSFTLSREGDRIRIRAEYVISKPEHLIDPLQGHAVELDPELSGARFSIDIAVGQDGSVDIVSPVTVASALLPKAA